MQIHLNVDQWVMARDRHRLNRLRKDKKTETAEIEKLFQQSNDKVKQRLARIPQIKLNQDLPVTQYADRLIEAIQKHQVIIVAGETGSGKTTQLPQIAMLAGRGLTGMIGHTQPRRLAARSVSQRIAEEVGQKLGEAIGFKIRFNEQGSQDSIVRLMTDGILLAELTNDRFLSKYDTIIIDTAGRVLDMISDQLKTDAKNIRRGSNELSMQGYGKLGSMFTNWLKSLRNMGKDIVILAHAAEDKDGDNIIKRPDMVGGSKKEVYKVADMMGYMTVVQGMQGAERVLAFAPSPNYLTKDSGQVGNITVTDMVNNPNQLANIIQATKDHINSLSAEQVKYQQDLDEVRAKLMEVETVDALNDIKDSIDENHPFVKQMKADVWQTGQRLGFSYNRDDNKFEAVEVESA